MLCSSSVTDKVHIPSIKFCKQYTFKNPYLDIIEELDSWNSTSSETIRDWVIQNVMTMDLLFTFVQHRSESIKFTCDTLFNPFNDGPCTFPFKIFDCGLADLSNPEVGGNCDIFEAAEMETLTIAQ